jgi:hypothetical protein
VRDAEIAKVQRGYPTRQKDRAVPENSVSLNDQLTVDRIKTAIAQLEAESSASAEQE